MLGRYQHIRYPCLRFRAINVPWRGSKVTIKQLATQRRRRQLKTGLIHYAGD